MRFFFFRKILYQHTLSDGKLRIRFVLINIILGEYNVRFEMVFFWWYLWRENLLRNLN